MVSHLVLKAMYLSNESLIVLWLSIHPVAQMKTDPELSFWLLVWWELLLLHFNSGRLKTLSRRSARSWFTQNLSICIREMDFSRLSGTNLYRIQSGVFLTLKSDRFVLVDRLYCHVKAFTVMFTFGKGGLMSTLDFIAEYTSNKHVIHGEAACWNILSRQFKLDGKSLFTLCLTGFKVREHFRSPSGSNLQLIKLESETVCWEKESVTYSWSELRLIIVAIFHVSQCCICTPWGVCAATE